MLLATKETGEKIHLDFFKNITQIAWKVSVFDIFPVRTQYKCGKIRTRKIPKTGTFLAVASFFETIKKSGITYREEKKKVPMAALVLKGIRQALRLFVSECSDQKVAFHYTLIVYPLAISDPSGTLQYINQ